MPTLVLDSSVVTKWFLPEDYSAEARLIFELYRAGEWTLLSPDLMYAEVSNVLWKYQRKDKISASEAERVLEALIGLEIEAFPSSLLLEHAHELAVRFDRSLYDSLYLALSQRTSSPFVTADEKLFNAVRAHVEGIHWLGSLDLDSLRR